MARKPLPPTETIPAMIRFRQLAAEARDHLLLADGPPHPDHELLDLCGEALHHLGHAQKVSDSRGDLPWGNTTAEHKAYRAESARR